MKIYLKRPSIPELAALPEKERAAILHVCRDELLRDRRVWLWLGLLAAMLGFILRLCYRPDTYTPLLIGAIGGGAIGGFIFSQILIRVDLAHLRAAFSKRNQTA